VGVLKIREQQAERLGLNSYDRYSPVLTKMCLRICANESYQDAAADLAALSGVRVGRSSLHRLVQRQDFSLPDFSLPDSSPATEVSLNQLKVPLRTSGKHSSANLPVHRSASRSTDRSTDRSIDQSTDQPANSSAKFSADPSTSRSGNPPAHSSPPASEPQPVQHCEIVHLNQTYYGAVLKNSAQSKQQLANWIKEHTAPQAVIRLGDGLENGGSVLAELGETEQHRAILDWLHLRKKLYEVGGSLDRLAQAEHYLWHGQVDQAKALLQTYRHKQAAQFCVYLDQHRSHLVSYHQLYTQFPSLQPVLTSPAQASPAQALTAQALRQTSQTSPSPKPTTSVQPGTASGVEKSATQPIACRIELPGAQWTEKGVNSILSLRCAYLNGHLTVG